MYFGLIKIEFDREDLTQHDRKEMHSLVEKLRNRFKACVKPSAEFQKTGEPSVCIATLGASEGELNREIEEILDFCDTSGFGRIAEESVIIDHFDSYEEEPED